MAYHRFVTIDGQRHDITGLTETDERSCDRCGRYMTEWSIVIVHNDLLIDIPVDVTVELCSTCVGDHFPGLIDLAVKVMGRA